MGRRAGDDIMNLEGSFLIRKEQSVLLLASACKSFFLDIYHRKAI